MLSSGFFLKKKPHGTMPETPQELENRRNSRGQGKTSHFHPTLSPEWTGRLLRRYTDAQSSSVKICAHKEPS
jgi:hypothetical protein